MNLRDYQQLIMSLPVRQQSFTTKRDTWKKAESKVNGLSERNDKIFTNRKFIAISREDVFKGNAGERFLMTLYWGYPSGMRGRNFENIANHLEIILDALIDFINNNEAGPTEEGFKKFAKQMKVVPGLGLSTYSKLLYFFEPCIDYNPCLILDQRLIDCFANDTFSEFTKLKGINYTNAQSRYVQYLDLTKDLADSIGTKPENIEQFLFLFGNNLKVKEEVNSEISTYWNGYCPESYIKGKRVRMRLNTSDFFESEETGLQICLLPGVQAIVLNFRGKGKFRVTPEYGDEIVNGEILSPQNMGHVPFNNPTVIFNSGEEIRNYIKALK